LGTSHQISLLNIISTIKNAVGDLSSKGIKLTQSLIAEVLGCTQQNVSKVLIKSGVTAEAIASYFRKILPPGYTTAPIESNNSSGCEAENPDPTRELLQDERVREMLGVEPFDRIYMTGRTIMTRGWDYFETEYLSRMTRATYLEFLGYLALLLNPEMDNLQLDSG
jgi:hypothetical protein